MCTFSTTFGVIGLLLLEFGIIGNFFSFSDKIKASRSKELIIKDKLFSADVIKNIKKYNPGSNPVIDQLLQEIWDFKDESNWYKILNKNEKKIKSRLFN